MSVEFLTGEADSVSLSKSDQCRSGSVLLSATSDFYALESGEESYLEKLKHNSNKLFSEKEPLFNKFTKELLML